MQTIELATIIGITERWKSFDRYIFKIFVMFFLLGISLVTFRKIQLLYLEFQTSSCCSFRMILTHTTAFLFLLLLNYFLNKYYPDLHLSRNRNYHFHSYLTISIMLNVSLSRWWKEVIYIHTHYLTINWKSIRNYFFYGTLC